MADAYLAQGRYDEAARLYEQAEAGCRAALGVEHPDTLSAIRSRARLLWKTGDVDGSAALLREALEAAPTVFGEGHPAVFEVARELSLMFIENDRRADGIDVMQRLLETLPDASSAHAAA